MSHLQPSTVSDLVLFRQVVEHRDPEAYSELYRRLTPTAYRFALALTRRPAPAEDAVQEAMLDLWQTRTAIEWGESLKPIVLKLVYRRAMHQLAKARSLERLALKCRGPQAHQSEAGECSVTGNRQEELRALGSAVDELERADRALLALYFGQGLAQDQIGKILGYSQRTVSNRMRRILAVLKRKVEAVSLGVALPFDPDLLRQVFVEQEPPACLLEAPPEGLNSVRMGYRPGAPLSFTSALERPGLMAVAALFLLAVSGMAWVFWDGESGGVRVAQSSIEAASRPDIRPPNQAGLRKWSFNRPGDTDGLRLELGGGARWQASGGVADSPYLAFNNSGTIRLPALKGPFPFQVTLHLRFGGVDLTKPAEPRPFAPVGGFDCFLSRIQPYGIHRISYGFMPISTTSSAWYTLRYCVTEDLIDYWINNSHIETRMVKTGGDNRDLALSFAGVDGLDELEIRALSSQELPNLEDPQRIMAALPYRESSEPEARVLPDIPTWRPPLKTHLFLNLKIPGDTGKFRPDGEFGLRCNSMDFDQEVRLDGFYVEGGAWRWAAEAGLHGSGALEITQTQKDTRIILVGFETVSPYRLTLRFKLLGYRRGQAVPSSPIEAVWGKCGLRAFFRFAGDLVDLKENEWMTFSALLTDRRIDQYIDGKRLDISYYPEYWVPICVLQVGLPLLLDDLKVEPLAAKDLPEDSAFLEALKRIPSGSAQGEFPVSGIPSGIPGKQVHLRYIRPHWAYPTSRGP